MPTLELTVPVRAESSITRTIDIAGMSEQEIAEVSARFAEEAIADIQRAFDRTGGLEGAQHTFYACGFEQDGEPSHEVLGQD